MAKVERLRPLLRALEKLERESKRKNNGSVTVGYAASYALYVHENKEMKLRGQLRGPAKGKKGYRGRYWDPQGKGQAKFLEQPFREKSKEISTIVVTAKKRGVPLVKALILGGLFLQRESQKLVPVDLGNLKASAFTEKE